MEIVILVVIILAIINVLDAREYNLMGMLNEEQKEKKKQESGSLKARNYENDVL